MNNRGFTLLEMVVVLALTFLIGGAIVEIFLSSFRTTNNVFEQLSVQTQAKRTIFNFVKEMREANYSNEGAYPLVAASSTEIIFYSNIDDDSSVERVRYFVSSTMLKKAVLDDGLENISTVVETLTSTSTPIFTYYDENYEGSGAALSVPITTTTIVKMVKMNIVIDKNPDFSPTPLAVQGSAEIRVLKTN